MAKIKINQRLRDKKGEFVGSKMTCIVVNPDHTFVFNAEGRPTLVDLNKPELHKTLKSAVIESILADDPNGGGEASKLKRYAIYRKVDDAELEVDIESGDIQLIKDCVIKYQPTLFAGQCAAMLEGEILDEEGANNPENGLAEV